MSNLLPPGFLFWDGVKYVITSTGPSGGQAGGDLAGSYPNPLVAKINGVAITGIPSSGKSIVATGPTSASWQTVAAGNTLVYRQGEPSPSGNVYASWTALMAARALIHGPAVIAIDCSITAKPAIDPGTWDLTNNTAIIGNSFGPLGSGQSSILGIATIGGSDAQLLNPVWFQDIIFLCGNTTLPCIDVSAGKKVAFDCYNTIFLNSGTPTIINAVNGAVITLGGSSGFATGLCLGGAIAGTCSLVVNDSSAVEASTIVTSGTLNILINGITALCSNSQPGSSGITFLSGNFSGNVNPFSTAANGTVLTKTDTNQAEWLTPSGGITQLTGDVTAGPGAGSQAATVASIQGVAISGTPSAGQVLEATSPTAASWQTPPGGVSVEQSGTPITGNPHSTLNLIGIGAVDSGGGVATVTGGTAPDNASGRRIALPLQSRRHRNETGQLVYTNGPPTIPTLTDSGSALAGRAIAALGDKLLFTGFDGVNQHALYGIDLRTSPYNTSLTNSTTPLTSYATTTPRILLGIRGQSSGVNRDFVFASVADSSPAFVELGYITGPFPYTYTQVYHTLTPEFALNACELPAGNTAGPVFAYIATSSRIFIVDATGTTHLAFTGTDFFGTLCVDDQGFLWVSNSNFTGSNRWLKFSINYSTFTLTLVQTVDYSSLFSGAAAQQICCDGRFIRGFAGFGGFVQLVAFDTLTGLQGPGPFSTGVASTFGASSQQGIRWDGEAIWMTLTNLSASTCIRMHPMTGEILLTVPGVSAIDTRGSTLDDSGTFYVAGITGGNLGIYTSTPAYPTANFDSIRSLNRPLAYEIGGRKQGSTVCASGATVTLDLTSQIVRCQPSGAACTVNLPASATLTALGVPEWEVLVIDETATSATHNITVSGNGANLETPGTPGTYAASATISTNSQAVTWMWNGTQWKIVSIFP